MNVEDYYGMTYSASFESAVRAIFGRTCIIEYGIIKEIPEEAEGAIVSVLVSVAKNTSDMRLYTCPLISFGGSSLIVKTEPKVNDKVIVLFPRRYNDEMFLLDEEHEDTIIDEYATGYNAFGGIAILANRFDAESYGNQITVEEESIKANFHVKKEGSETNPNTVAEIKKDGSISIESIYDKGTDSFKFSSTVSSDGSWEMKTKNPSANTSVKISAGSDGEVLIDNGKAKVTVKSDGSIEINSLDSKISIKNNKANLFTILKNTFNTLNNSLKTSGSPAKHVVDPNQFSNEANQLSDLLEE